MISKSLSNRITQGLTGLLIVLLVITIWRDWTGTGFSPEQTLESTAATPTIITVAEVVPKASNISSASTMVSTQQTVANAFIPESAPEVDSSPSSEWMPQPDSPIVDSGTTSHKTIAENPVVTLAPTSPSITSPPNDLVGRILASTPAFDVGIQTKSPPKIDPQTRKSDFLALDAEPLHSVEPKVDESHHLVDNDSNLNPIIESEPHSAFLDRSDFQALPPAWLEGKNIDSIATESYSPMVADDSVRNTALTQPLPTQAPSSSIQGTTDYVLAGQPKIGDRWKSETPVFDPCACEVTACLDDFSPDPIDECHPYDPYLNQQVYEGKQLNATQRPLLELGQPWYQLGQLSPGYNFLGQHNNVNPQFLVFGDFRNAIASNTVNGDNVSQFAWELNTFWSFFITGTERLVTGVTPLDNGAQNTRWLLDDDRFEFEGDFDFDFGYLEGDLGAITGGFVGETLPFDLPFAAGLTPLFIQNGIWLNDALEGVFFTLPARNSPMFNISNMDITFAYVYDDINSAAFGNDNGAAKAYAFFLFIEALNGYIEADYAFLEDRNALNRSYHNISMAYTRRFGRFVSHSSRVIVNAGQDVTTGDQTADGVLLLSENSLITRNPYTVIPYFNFFAGFDTPQSFAGDAELVNTGILFESDGMTGFPTLDGRGQDTFGYGIGLNLLAQDFSQQLILETAAVFRNDDSDLAGDQYGVGMRYQLPLSNSWIFRTDGMFGFLRNDDDDFGMRMELRKKF